MARPKKETIKEESKTTNSFDFFNKLKTKNVYAENKEKFDNFYFINTGCYVLNALISGDLNGGFPSNRMIMLAGEESVGKSLFAQIAFVLPAMKEGRFTYYMDTEHAMEEKNLVNIGMPEGSFSLLRNSFVEGVREEFMDLVDKTKKHSENITNAKDLPKMMLVLDSQGAMVTRKAVEKSLTGEPAKDMSLQSNIKRLYAELINDCGMMGIPLVVTNHVYANVGGYGDPKVISGGSGGKYLGSNIFMLSKTKEREGTGEDRVRTGTIFNFKVLKSRFVADELKGKIYMSFKHGLNPWYGLHEFALKAGLLEDYVESTHTKLGVPKPEGLGRGNKYVLKNTNISPDKWVVCNDKTLHTKDGIGSILEPLNEWVKENFKLKTPVSLSLDDDLGDGIDISASDSDID